MKENETVLSEHPVSDDMRANVKENLGALERQHQVKVLFACESGSRGWGFASPDSDYDVRFIYVHRLPWYLTVAPGRDVIELPISGELDVNGWDLRKALALLRESNPTLLEWLGSPIVYREDAGAMTRFRMLAQDVFSNAKGWHHYASMAKKNFREHLQAEEVRYKKYLYVLRPLLAARWIRARSGVQAIRAYRLEDLRDAAQALGQHFLYANLAHALSKADVLELIGMQFYFPPHYGKNFDALYDCLTDPLHKSGPQPGFVVVLDQIPTAMKFDREAREQLLDVFMDAAEYWAERKIPFRCFYSFL